MKGSAKCSRTCEMMTRVLERTPKSHLDKSARSTAVLASCFTYNMRCSQRSSRENFCLPSATNARHRYLDPRRVVVDGSPVIVTRSWGIVPVHGCNTSYTHLARLRESTGVVMRFVHIFWVGCNNNRCIPVKEYLSACVLCHGYSINTTSPCTHECPLLLPAREPSGMQRYGRQSAPRLLRG